MGKAPSRHAETKPERAVEWSLGQSFDFIVELWSVDGTIEAMLEALAYKNEKFMEEVQRLLKAKDKLKK